MKTPRSFVSFDRFAATGLLLVLAAVRGEGQTAIPCAAPSGTPPSGVGATASPPNVVVKWNSVSGARGYAVARRNPDGTCWNLTGAGITATSFSEVSPATDGAYGYQVAVQTLSGVGISQWVSFTVSSSSLFIAPPSTLTTVTVMSDGPPPTGLAARGTPTTATLTWTPVAGATGYIVNRAVAGTTAWTALTPAQITTASLANDVLPDWRQTYMYQVLAYQATGHFGSASVNYTAPKPTDPTGMTATLATATSVRLTWQAAPYATGYLVSGPGVANATQVTGTSFTVSNAPVGFNVYRVASVFTPGGVLTTATSWPSAVARVAPSPMSPFLSLANGPGSDGLTLRHYDRGAFCWTFSMETSCDDVLPVPQGARSLGSLLETWGGKGFRLSDIYPKTVVFADTTDLGFGRRVWCSKTMNLVCLASSHGPVPGTVGFNDPRRIGDAAALNLESRGYSVIARDLQGTLHFISFVYAAGFDPAKEPDPVKRFVAQLNNAYAVTPQGTIGTSTFDTQGPKLAPNACLACHGGRFNTGDGTVMGGSLLPIDPARLSFPSQPGATRAEQELAIYNLNGWARDGAPPMVIDYVRGMYANDAVKTAQADFVPPGWTTQPALWRTVIRPYCISCHMAQSDALGFRSFADLQMLKDRVQKSMCTDGMMPHAELPFRRFWSAGGPVYLAGLLSTLLGFPACP